MEMSQFILLTPQLIVAAGIVMALLLISWQRSQRLISLFTQVILIVALVAAFNALGTDGHDVTRLMRVDDYSRYAFILVCLTSLVAVYLSRKMLVNHVEVHDEYYVLILLIVLGAGVLVASNHYASLFLGFEVLSIALVGLVGYLRSEKYAVETGFKYLILSASASSFMLLGIAFIYAQTGSLSFSQPSLVADTLSANSIVDGALLYQIGFILFFSGIAFKLSLVPFHFWTPDVYQGSPTPVTLLLATVSKLAMFIVLLKCCFSASQINITQQSNLVDVIGAVAILSMLIGNTLALKQNSIKRVLGFSSIAHMGYLLIVLLVSSSAGVAFAWQSVMFYLTAYVLATVSLFTVIALLELKAGLSIDVELDNLKGLFWQQPALALLAIVAILSLAGIPLTAGFIGKFYLLSFAAEQHLWALLASLVIGSGIGLGYYLPIIFKLFAEKEHEPDGQPTVWQLGFDKIFVMLLIVLGLGIGIFPNSLSHIIASLS